MIAVSLGKLASLGFVFMLASGCGPDSESLKTLIKNNPRAFTDYWYQGKAELTRYRLKQARYGELHEGDAVLIFVTEDFLNDAQVKKEFGEGASESVLKLNATRTFYTGIYPYSLMTSVFTVVDFNRLVTPKVTFSGQEWCGQVYTQMNLREGLYHVQSHSYFQNEGDQEFELPKALLEDEVWTLIRISPENLPTGDIDIIPSAQFSRLRHLRPGPLKARASLLEKKDRRFSKEKLFVYEIIFEEPERRLAIYFEKQAPYRIAGWRDTYASGFGDKARQLTTTAVRTHTLFTDYWNHNRAGDRKIRKQLGLR